MRDHRDDLRKETAMRPILFAAAMSTAASVLGTADAGAQDYPWCSVDSGDAGRNCSFGTYEHCLATISGIGGCIPNLIAAAPARSATIQSSLPRKNLDYTKHNVAKRGSTKYVATKGSFSNHVSSTNAQSKRGSTKHVSTNGGSPKQIASAANTGTSIRPTSTTFIPLPDPALLTPPPEFDCEFKSAGLEDARAQPQSSAGAQTEPGIDGAMRMTLDYERQCYQHAETIVRDRLRRLQTVGETVKAVNNGH
jgi:hypothetical protein